MNLSFSQVIWRGRHGDQTQI